MPCVSNVDYTGHKFMVGFIIIIIIIIIINLSDIHLERVNISLCYYVVMPHVEEGSSPVQVRMLVER